MRSPFNVKYSIICIEYNIYIQYIFNNIYWILEIFNNQHVKRKFINLNTRYISTAICSEEGKEGGYLARLSKNITNILKY